MATSKQSLTKPTIDKDFAACIRTVSVVLAASEYCHIFHRLCRSYRIRKFTIYYITVLLNYSNSFVNPVVYALRIPEFKQVMGKYCLRRPNARSMMHMTKKNSEGISSRASAVTLTSMLAAVETAPNQLAFEQEIENTQL